MTYGYYLNNDDKKEIIFKLDVASKEEAILQFAFLKQLSIDQFQENYTVIQL